MSLYQWSPGQGYSEDYPGTDSGQLLRRIEPKPNWTANSLLTLIETGQPKALPFVGKEDGEDGWRSSWGNVTEQNGALKLAAIPTTVGSLALLDGTRLWKDYVFKADFNWDPSATSVSLIGHFQRDVRGQSYLECEYVNGMVVLRQNVNGAPVTISDAKDPTIVPGNGKTAGISFSGNYAQCLWNGGVLLGMELPSSAPQDGGVAVSAWSSALGTANIEVTKTTVSASTQ